MTWFLLWSVCSRTCPAYTARSPGATPGDLYYAQQNQSLPSLHPRRIVGMWSAFFRYHREWRNASLTLRSLLPLNLWNLSRTSLGTAFIRPAGGWETIGIQRFLAQ